MTNTAANDHPIQSSEEDRYGFTVLAESLARSILGLDDNVSTVIGIEGKWGSGKTSLLNLLQIHLKQNCPDGMHILEISPWLIPNGAGSVESLLIPVAAIVNEADEKRYGKLRRLWRKLRNSQASERAGNVLRYAQQASGRLSPLVELAGDWVPGAGFAARTMKNLSASDLSTRRQTTAELRRQIEASIARLRLSFIVVLDDLDRLEPAQAVEVLRLVRSVADFSRFRYVMCYDPEVLARAVETGLGIEDGRRYLQKIVPLSFSLPLPEPFDLRREFRENAMAYYLLQHGQPLKESARADLEQATDIYGQGLTTPREVSLALSAVRFRYPDMRDYVYFPDLCLLQLLRVVNPGLYVWIEHYLGERSVTESGDGTISSAEVSQMKKQLTELLSEFSGSSPRNPWTLGQWIPGIQGDKKKEPRIFEAVSEELKDEATSLRRLSSAGFWRYYFSFSAPQNVLPESDIELILTLAAEDDQGLAEKVLSTITGNGISSRTWFEHIVVRLTPAIIGEASVRSLEGLLRFFFNYSDEVAVRFRQRNAFFRLQETGIDSLLMNIIQQLMKGDRRKTLRTIEILLQSGKAQWWIAGFMRHQMWQNGLAGNRPVPEALRLFTQDEICQLRDVMADHINRRSGSLIAHEHEEELLSYLYAWRDIAGSESVTTWAKETGQNDETWLRLLLCLRSKGVRSDCGRLC